MMAEIVRPVFLVGVGRSGTTVLYEMLAGHCDFAWFSNYTERAPRLPQLAALSTLYAPAGLKGRPARLMPRPVEGYRLWDGCTPPFAGPSEAPLTEADVTDGAVRRTRRLIAAHLRWQRKPRF